VDFPLPSVYKYIVLEKTIKSEDENSNYRKLVQFPSGT